MRKKVELSVFNSVVGIKPPSLEAMHSIHMLVHSCICSACFQCMFCVPNFFGTQGLVYGSEGGMEYFVRAHPHISFYNPVAAKVGQVTFDQSTPDSKLTLQLCCYGQTRNYLLTKKIIKSLHYQENNTSVIHKTLQKSNRIVWIQTIIYIAGA